MAENNFSASVHLIDGVPVVKFSGDINGFAEGAMNSAFSEAENHAQGAVTLDFSDVIYINSTGIALIVGLLAKARMAKIKIRAAGLNEHYREIFTITRLSDFMELA